MDRNEVVTIVSFIGELAQLLSGASKGHYVLYFMLQSLSLLSETLKKYIMNTMTVRDFRTNLSANFDRVDAGERILVRRRNRVYTIVPVEDDDLTITPELQAKIDKARQEYKKGKTLHFESAEAVQKWMDEL